MNEAIKKIKSGRINIQFLAEEKDLSNFLENIKKFGGVGEKETKYKFKFIQGKNYIVDNNGLRVIKSKDGWDGLVLGDKEIPKNEITKWKIKLNSNLNSSYDELYIGIGKSNSKGTNDMWSIYSHCLNIQVTLQGKAPNSNIKNGKFKKDDIIEVIVDRISNQLSFAVNNVNYGIVCSNIPKDIELYPAIYLYEQNLDIELI